MSQPDFLIVGAGIFGITTALGLRARGHNVGIVDPGPVPHPLAASTDISKVIRMEYGSDAAYMTLANEAISGWQRWNEEFDQALFHQTGVIMLTRTAMAPGEFEFESYRLLKDRGHAPQRLDEHAISERFPAWKPGTHVDGFFNPRGGYAESGRVVAALWQQAQRAGVVCRQGQTARKLERRGDRIAGVLTTAGERLTAERFVVCAGAWTQTLVPELAAAMKASGHPVFHLRPERPPDFVAERFPVFTADISKTGWYGFPLHPYERVIKFGHHGVGRSVDPKSDERVVTPAQWKRLDEFLAATFPELASAQVVFSRLCLYSDTLDEHFWIDRHPEIANLTVAAGGSGHAFKMAPVLGELIANRAAGVEDPRCERFRWRHFDTSTKGEEEARCHQ